MRRYAGQMASAFLVLSRCRLLARPISTVMSETSATLAYLDGIACPYADGHSSVGFGGAVAILEDAR